jgi:site-specific DNA-methyltransferase (adenine-specific)
MDGLCASKTKYSNGQESILFFTKTEKHIFNYNDIKLSYESTERIKHAKKKVFLKMVRGGFLTIKENYVERFGIL